MNRKYNVLLITSKIPYPPHRGDKLKIYNIIKLLSQNHSISLLTFVQDKSELQYLEEIRGYCSSIETVYLPRWRAVFNCVRNLFSPLPFQVSYYFSRKMKKKVNEIIQKENIDIIHTHLIRMAPFCNNLLQKRKILDLTDAVSLYLRRYAKHNKNPFIKWMIFWEYKKVQRYEAILHQFDRSLVCSRVDREALASHYPDSKIEVSLNGVDTDYFKNEKHKNPGVSNRIIYTGNLSYPPNEDGILYFAREIWPIVKEKIPDLMLYVVGQCPTRKVMRLANKNGIIVTGCVDDIRPYYLSSMLTVCPVRFGAGTLNKVLESLALGIPVVSTSLGCAGLDLTPGRDILVADEPQQFADQIIRLIKDPDLRKKLAVNGRKAIESNYRWTQIVNKLEDIYGEIIDGS